MSELKNNMALAAQALREEGTVDLEVRWSVTHAAEYSGYAVCSLWFRGRKIATATGGNYDLRGSVFGKFIEAALQPELNSPNMINGNGVYKGIGHTWVNGAFDFSTVIQVALACGYSTRTVPYKKRLFIVIAKIDR